MSAVCIIPARGGSRRIPGKNIKIFHGIPIIAYSIMTAKQSEIFDDIVVSTDCGWIAATARQYGASVLIRPAVLADDITGTQEVMCHALMTLGKNYDFACCLYATAPMLDYRTLITARRMLNELRSRYVVPIATWLRDPGQFYFGESGSFLNRHSLLSSFTTMLPIPEETECDINTPEDWVKAEKMYAELKAKGMV